MCRKLILLTVGVISLVVGCFCGRNANALTSQNSLYNLSVFKGVEKCYATINNTVKADDWQYAANDFDRKIGVLNLDTDTQIYITTGVGNKLDSSDRQARSNLTCEEIFNGYDGGGGKASGLADIYNNSTMFSNIENWGYEGTGNGDSAYNFDVVLERPNDASNANKNAKLEMSGYVLNCQAKKDGDTNKLVSCGPGYIVVDENDRVIFNLGVKSGNHTLQPDLSATPYSSAIKLTRSLDDDYRHLMMFGYSGDVIEGFKETGYYKDLLSAYQRSLSESNYNGDAASIKVEWHNLNDPNKSVTSSFDEYKLKYTNKKDDADYLLFKLGTKTDIGSVLAEKASYIWENKHIYSLYSYYLQQLKNDDEYKDSITIEDCSDNKPSAVGFFYKNSSSQWCVINLGSKADEILKTGFSVVKNGDLEWGTARDFLQWLMLDESYNGITDADYANSSVDENGNLIIDDIDPGESESAPSTCMNSGAANTLGWILCPLLDWLSDAAIRLYDDYVEPSLIIEPTLFSDTSDGGDGSRGARAAWDAFRSIANILFIVLLLVVIFSQLTGVGISNYGIKRILPKMIVAIILMNASYWICQLFVDISNIVGNGIGAFFETLGSNMEMPETIGGVSIRSTAETVGSGILWGVGILAALVTGVWAAIGTIGPTGILLMLLMTAITVVVSILSLFVILSARQAAVVILTVLSPVAFACMILPNTQKTFDKWLSFGKALLFVYPVCSFLVYGGNYVSKLMLVANAMNGEVGLLESFTAMIMGVAPIFFIPTVIKRAINLAGNIGTRISQFGGRIGGMGKRYTGMTAKAAGNKYRGSDFYRRRLAKGTRAAIERGEAVSGGRATRGQRIRYILGGGASGIRKKASELSRIEQEDLANRKLVDKGATGNYNAAITKDLMDNLIKEIDSGDSEATFDQVQQLHSFASILTGSQDGRAMLSDYAENASGYSAEALANLASQDSDIKNAIASKNIYASSKLADIAAGVVGSKMSQDDYDNLNYEYLEQKRKEAAEARRTGKKYTPISADDQSKWLSSHPGADKTTAGQYITRNVVDKPEDLLGLKGSVMAKHLDDLDQDIINSWAENPNIVESKHFSPDKIKRLKAAAAKEYVDKTTEKPVQIRDIQYDNSGAVNSFQIKKPDGSWANGDAKDFTKYMTMHDYNNFATKQTLYDENGNQKIVSHVDRQDNGSVKFKEYSSDGSRVVKPDDTLSQDVYDSLMNEQEYKRYSAEYTGVNKEGRQVSIRHWNPKNGTAEVSSGAIGTDGKKLYVKVNSLDGFRINDKPQNTK